MSPGETVPSPLIKMWKTPKIFLQYFLVIAVKFMIPKYWEIRDLFLAKFFVHIVKLLPVFLRTSPGCEIAKVDYKGRFTPRDLIDDSFSYSVIPFPPELPVTRPLCIADNKKEIFRGLNICEAGVGRRLDRFISLEGH